LEASHTAVRLSACMSTKVERPRIDVRETAGAKNTSKQEGSTPALRANTSTKSSQKHSISL